MVMKQTILLILVLVPLNLFGQRENQKSYSNVRNHRYVNIPGTRLYIMPPDGFKVAANFLGLQKDENSEIQIMDLGTSDFSCSTPAFKRSVFEVHGDKILEFKECKLNGFSAKYVHKKRNLTTDDYNLLLGDSTFSIMLVGRCLANDTITARQIKDALFSVTYDKTLKIDPIANAVFQFDDTTTKFRFFKSVGNVYLYTIGGIFHPTDTDSPIVRVNPMLNNKRMTAPQIADLVLWGFEKQGLVDKRIKNQSTVSVNGYTTLEEEVYGKIQNKNRLIYLLIVLGENNVVAFQGLAQSDFENNITEFKKMSHTIRLK